MLDDLLLADDLQLLWYHPQDGAHVPESNRDGLAVQSNSVGAAILVDLLLAGAALLVPRKFGRNEVMAAEVELLFAQAMLREYRPGDAPPKASKLTRAERKLSRDELTRSHPELRLPLAAVSTDVAAADTPPAHAGLVPAWEALTRQGRPHDPSRVLLRLASDSSSRLTAAGLVERFGGQTRLTEAGRDLARGRREELDAYLLDGVRPPAGFARRTRQLAALLLDGDSWRSAYPAVPEQELHELRSRLYDLRCEAVSGPDELILTVVGYGLRLATAAI